jgi:hypothetical protein
MGSKRKAKSPGFAGKLEGGGIAAKGERAFGASDGDGGFVGVAQEAFTAPSGVR